MKQLVVCGNCEIVAGTSVKRWTGTGFSVELKRPGGIVLGEIAQTGDFLIKRGGENYTRVTGNNFSVLCGKCNSPVYKKEVSIMDITYQSLKLNWVGSLTG